MPKVKDLYTVCIKIQDASSDSDGNNEFRISDGMHNRIKEGVSHLTGVLLQISGTSLRNEKTNKTSTVISNERQTTPNDWSIIPGKKLLTRTSQ